jgi:chromosome segregation ATPase
MKMEALHPRKVRRFLKYFKQGKEEKLEPVKPYYESVKKESLPKPKAEKELPRVEIRSDLYEKLRFMKDDFQPVMPKIIVETKEKEALRSLSQKTKETEKELNEDERRIYDLFSEISGMKDEIKKDEEESNDQEEEIKEQDERITQIEEEIEDLRHRKPVIVKEEIIKFEPAEMPRPEKIEQPIMAKDKKIDAIQGALLEMQDKLNKLIEIKVTEESEKMKEHQERLKEMDKIIKIFEMKLIKLQGKYSQKKLKPLIDKIAHLKNRYNELAVKMQSHEKFELRPMRIEPLPELPDEFRSTKPAISSGYVFKPLPSSLELPDINSEIEDIRLDLPEPVPNMVQLPRREDKMKKKGFFTYVQDEVKKFIRA